MTNETKNEIIFGESTNTIHKKHMKASTKRKIGNTTAYILDSRHYNQTQPSIYPQNDASCIYDGIGHFVIGRDNPRHPATDY